MDEMKKAWKVEKKKKSAYAAMLLLMSGVVELLSRVVAAYAY
uniref:Uncharacterized protein n=1 Tax=Utricularia reniformis TaxID=192314 RepID=A0A1Y0AZG4_9LAMI|nr:hypothetical protein AEK19_MT0257 [Utricularia reniformis]ART30534.1 hypothetical protein AEK19_MT0257 [Utricularia reniformis]